MKDFMTETDENINNLTTKLTNQQSQILSLITTCKHPLTAHEILIKLKESNSKANRMTVYRSLEYLVQKGIIHKVDFNNSYRLCDQPQGHNCQILVCQDCGNQLEIHSTYIEELISKIRLLYKFNISNLTQFKGLCLDCQLKN